MTSKLAPIAIVLLCSVALIGAGYATITNTFVQVTENTTDVDVLSVDISQLSENGVAQSSDTGAKLTLIKETSTTKTNGTVTLTSTLAFKDGAPSIYVNNTTGVTTCTVAVDFGDAAQYVTSLQIGSESATLQNTTFSATVTIEGSATLTLTPVFKTNADLNSITDQFTFDFKVTVTPAS